MRYWIVSLGAALLAQLYRSAAAGRKTTNVALPKPISNVRSTQYSKRTIDLFVSKRQTAKSPQDSEGISRVVNSYFYSCLFPKFDSMILDCFTLFLYSFTCFFQRHDIPPEQKVAHFSLPGTAFFIQQHERSTSESLTGPCTEPAYQAPRGMSIFVGHPFTSLRI